MTEKHSPLPWKVYKNKDGTRLVGVGDANGTGVLDAGFGVWSWDHPEGIANAEMVVRAVNGLPEAIAALEAARPSVYQMYEAFGDPDNEGAVLKQIDAALTKLKG